MTYFSPEFYICIQKSIQLLNFLFFGNLMTVYSSQCDKSEKLQDLEFIYENVGIWKIQQPDILYHLQTKNAEKKTYLTKFGILWSNSFEKIINISLIKLWLRISSDFDQINEFLDFVNLVSYIFWGRGTSQLLTVANSKESLVNLLNSPIFYIILEEPLTLLKIT